MMRLKSRQKVEENSAGFRKGQGEGMFKNRLCCDSGIKTQSLCV